MDARSPKWLLPLPPDPVGKSYNRHQKQVVGLANIKK